jgi:hypothetical protein
MRISRLSFPGVCQTASILATCAALQFPAYSQDLPPADVIADAPVEIDVDTQIKAPKPARIAAPPGVIIAAPDEDIILETAPGKPRVEINKKVRTGKADSDIERRLDRMERMIETLVENDRMNRKNGPVVAFNGKEFAKVQKDMDRAMREADIAIRKMPKIGKDDFNFEHHFSFKGDGRNQRKVLEAQRKALQKQLEVLDRQLESLDQEEQAKDDGSEKKAEQESQSSQETETSKSDQ